MPGIQKKEQNVTIHCGDCLPFLSLMAPKSIDTVLTDPPYNNGCSYANYDDSKTDEEYASWCHKWFIECQRIARRVIIFPGPWNLPMWMGFERPSGIGCWAKPGCPSGMNCSSFQFCEWEPFLVYGGTRLGGSNLIYAPVSKQKEMFVGGHPCPKPLHLMMEIVRKVKGESILDPFLGSGSTGVAAVLARKRFVGIELDPGYCSSASFRISRVSKRMESK